MNRAVYNQIKAKTLGSTNIFGLESEITGFNLITKRFKKRKPALTVKLLTYVEKLGQAGDVVKVRPGHMRNELYPKQLAQYVIKELTQINRAQLELNKTKEGDKEESTTSKQTFASYMRLARIHRELKAIEDISFTRAVVGENSDNLYGSVTVEDLIRVLRDEHYLAIEKDIISLEKIKKLGTYFAQIDLGSIGVHSLKVVVNSDIPLTETPAPNSNTLNA